MKDFVLEAMKSLPPMPKSVEEFNEYFEKTGMYMNVEEMKKVLEKNEDDKNIVLKLVNSPIYNLKDQVSLDRVLQLLGPVSVKNILIADTMSKYFKFDMFLRNEIEGANALKCVCDLSPYGLDGDLFMESLNRQLKFTVSWLLAEDKKNHILIPPLMSFRLGLIFLSQVIILNGLKDKFYSELENRNFKNIGEVEREFLGTDHIDLVSFIISQKDNDTVLLNSIKHLRNPELAPKQYMKEAYIFHIIDKLFDYDGRVMELNVNVVLNTMESLEEKGISFNINAFKEAVMKEFSYIEL